PYDGITLVSSPEGFSSLVTGASVWGRAGGVTPARSLFFASIFALRLASQVLSSPTGIAPGPGRDATAESHRSLESRQNLGRSSFEERADNRSAQMASRSARMASRSAQMASRSAQMASRSARTA